jgi:hypothetical protein
VALALGYQRASDLPQAKKSTIPRLLPQKHFQEGQDIPAPEELRGLARSRLSKIVARELKARGPRMTAVFYPAGPCGSFAASRWRTVREIAFVIGMQWQHGRDESDPRETHVLRALLGRAFSALELG